MKYYVLAGEASGDKQAALLCAAIFQNDAGAKITGWGGEAMEATSVTVTKHYSELAFMGFAEVVKHLPAIFKNFKTSKKEIADFAPDALILVDYPGFNLRIAKWAFRQKIPVYYYISPQLWAWHTSRVHGIKKAVRKMYVILPFEKDFYEQYQMQVMYIGHPLAVEIKRAGDFDYAPQENHIALLPGSRTHEVDRILPIMAALIQKMPESIFTVAAVSHLPRSIYEKWLGSFSNVKIVVDDMKGALRNSAAAVVTSGTATLETALLGVPQIVVYKGSTFSYQIAKRLIKVNYISLVNLIMDKELIPELIQSECNPDNMHRQLTRMMQADVASQVKIQYKQLADLLTSGGGAPAAAIDIISDIGRQQ